MVGIKTERNKALGGGGAKVLANQKGPNGEENRKLTDRWLSPSGHHEVYRQVAKLGAFEVKRC